MKIEISDENYAAIQSVAEALGVDESQVADDILYWGATHELKRRAVEYLGELVHSWRFSSLSEASGAAESLELMSVEAALAGRASLLFVAEAYDRGDGTFGVLVTHPNAEGDWQPVLSS